MCRGTQYKHGSKNARDSLEGEVWSGVDGLADVVVDREGQDFSSTSGPHRLAVQSVHRPAQAHERSADVPHDERFNWRAVLLLQ